MTLPYWLTINWWTYILAPIDRRSLNCSYEGTDFLEDPVRFLQNLRRDAATVAETAQCRWRGHPAGPVWFNPNGYEPNMHCIGCGDEIG
jgi:hypothetical protein